MGYSEDVRLMNELVDKANREKHLYKKHLLLVASAMLGALLALYKKPETPLAFPHILFALALAVLSAGILLLSVGLYQLPNGQERLLSTYMEQLGNESRNMDKQWILQTQPKKIYLYASITGYVLLSLSLALFVAYLFV